MTKSYQDRRRYHAGYFEYLLDDDDGTAWINEGTCFGATVYTLPEEVVLAGKTYRLTSVEIAYNTEDDIWLKELTIPDSYEFIDEDSFPDAKLEKIRVGRGLEKWLPWSFRSASPTVEVTISPENPHLKVSDDGHGILSKDGRRFFGFVHKNSELSVPEGVEEICYTAISCLDNLTRLTLPSSIRTFESYGFFECRKLERLILPVAVPPTVNEDFEELPLDTCHLVVPREAVPAYRNHPIWGQFRHIDY